jgi:glucose-6-phosphate isomerase
MSNNPINKPQWSALKSHHSALKGTRTESLFDKNNTRFDELSFCLEGLLIDFSKNKITNETLNLLCDLARAQGLEIAKNKLFNGDVINPTEKRAALHTQLRDGSQDLEPLKEISAKIRNKEWLGVTGKPIENIIHIGLGGSSLGPELINDAFLEQKTPDINFHFITNIDGINLTRALSQCDPETTLFITVSKSFTTQETCMNTDTARQWLHDNLKDKNFIKHHFIAITANPEKALEYGLPEHNILSFNPAVGGRFSLWSSIGLTTAIAFGSEVFQQFLDGAHAIDKNFKNQPLESNIPALMALVDIWNRNFCDHQAKAILPYTQVLRKLPSYLQQLEMESNGKNIDLEGNVITYKTAPVIFGGVGTTSQHSFFQLFHQGTDIISGDFIGIKECTSGLENHHTTLLNNFLAQPQSLMQGKQSNVPHKQFMGDRPSTSIALDKMDAYHLGMLIALYEHKIFVQSVIWNINAFDQFGVELGKEMAHNMENHDLDKADPSTKALYSFITTP